MRIFVHLIMLRNSLTHLLGALWVLWLLEGKCKSPPPQIMVLLDFRSDFSELSLDKLEKKNYHPH